MPKDLSSEFIKIQDEYLLSENKAKGITDCNDLLPVASDNRLFIWQGDITTLKCDAIVNAANDKLLGCFVPNHLCIDNCIHSAAGLQLRNYGWEIMKKQGHDEYTGTAKITPAFNLPCRYVIHTVGPIVDGELTEKHKNDLESSYTACLDIAMKNDCRSIAFCCISTGVFAFPQREAAQIAVDTVKRWKEQNPFDIACIFNVFTDADRKIYDELLNY